MQGKVAVLTGGTSGIGLAAAEALAAQGVRIVLIARDRTRAAETMTRLQVAGPGAPHRVHLADLSRVSQTRRVGEEIAAQEPHIDLLINNAGGVFGRRILTSEGLEMTFATNHMAQFVLTQTLRERLGATPGARIINTSSNAHASGKLNLDDLQASNSYSAIRAYATSKLYTVLFTRELARRLVRTTANCFHPGFVASRFGSQAGGVVQAIAPLAKLFAISPQEGADTMIYLAASPQVVATTGLYFYKRKAIPTSLAGQDDAAAARLWTASEEIAAAIG